MAYGSTAGVQARAPAIGTLGGSTTPTSTQVTQWLAQASAEIDSIIAGAGYSLPVASGAAAIPVLDALADTYATAQAIRARGLDTISGQVESRSEVLMREYHAGLLRLSKGNLLALGLTEVAVGVLSPRRPRQIRALRRFDGYTRLDD